MNIFVFFLDMLSFIDVIKRRVHHLLKEKEETVSGHLSENWLSREAASMEATNKAGTFRSVHSNSHVHT